MTSASGARNVHRLFKAFRQKLRHVWEEYSFVTHYAPYLHRAIKNGEVAPLEFAPFLNDPAEKINAGREKSMAVLGQVLQNSIGDRVLLESIGAFEDLIGKIAEVVYLDYPGKLIGKNDVAEGENLKLARVVISSRDKDEIVERMAEEKIRSIFYGNPVNIFLKDSAKLDIGTIFSDRYRTIIDEYAEITARRNIIVHNSGRVDRKYLREVSGSKYQMGNKALVTDPYLRKSLSVLEGIAAVTAEAVVENVYKGQSRGKLAESLKSFRLGVGKAL